MKKFLPLTVAFGMLFSSISLPLPSYACPCGSKGCSDSCGVNGSCCSKKTSSKEQKSNTSMVTRKAKIARSHKSLHT